MTLKRDVYDGAGAGFQGSKLWGPSTATRPTSTAEPASTTRAREGIRWENNRPILPPMAPLDGGTSRERIQAALAFARRVPDVPPDAHWRSLGLG
jgi:hypothetical protein